MNAKYSSEIWFKNQKEIKCILNYIRNDFALLQGLNYWTCNFSVDGFIEVFVTN